MERKCSCGNFFDVREYLGICPECKKDIFETKNKPMTVIQLLFNELEKIHPSLFDIHTAKGREFVNHFHKYIELERQQIIDAYEVGEEDGYWHPEIGYSRKYKDAEQYYNDKYGK